MQYSDEDDDLYKNDPNEYIRRKFGEFVCFDWNERAGNKINCVLKCHGILSISFFFIQIFMMTIRRQCQLHKYYSYHVVKFANAFYRKP